MDKQKALDAIADEIVHCNACQEKKSGKAVPGEGNPDAKMYLSVKRRANKRQRREGRLLVDRGNCCIL